MSEYTLTNLTHRLIGIEHNGERRVWIRSMGNEDRPLEILWQEAVTLEEAEAFVNNYDKWAGAFDTR